MALSRLIHEQAFDRAEYFDVPTLDLHGRFSDEAWLETERFLRERRLLGDDVVKIIHGTGKQVLREMLLRKLATHPAVEAFRPSERPGWMDAVLLVVLRHLPT